MLFECWFPWSNLLNYFTDEDDEGDEDDESTYEEEDPSQDLHPDHIPEAAGPHHPEPEVLEQEECASCQQQQQNSSNHQVNNNLLHPNSIAAQAGKGSNDALDESLCGDPLMYATFVAPVHQYSTETEPSRQVRTISNRFLKL